MHVINKLKCVSSDTLKSILSVSLHTGGNIISYSSGQLLWSHLEWNTLTLLVIHKSTYPFNINTPVNQVSMNRKHTKLDR